MQNVVKLETPGNTGTMMVNGIAGEELLKIITQIEALEDQKKQIAEDIKDVFGEAKNRGFEPKIIRKILSLRKREPAEVDEEQSLLEIYMRAIGMLPIEE
jgi:uncharacterized protein (UPF0335 family)